MTRGGTGIAPQPAQFVRLNRGGFLIVPAVMRLIGHLPDEKLARRFADYLLVNNLPGQVEPEGSGQWAVWVLDDDHLEAAATELEAFRARPDLQQYLDATGQAAVRREQVVVDAQKAGARHIEFGRSDQGSLLQRVGRLTLVLMILSILVTFYTDFGDSEKAFNQFSITRMEFEGQKVKWSRTPFPEVRQGQVWRLVTPMFVHMDILHILFNLMWMAQLSTVVEKRYGWTRLLPLVLVVAAFSNTVEYLFVSPAFGGLSGVVFGLFGFVWTQSKYCRVSGFMVPPFITGLMIGWFIYCIVGLSGQVANFVHWGGLASGALIGYIASLLQRNDPPPVPEPAED